MSEKKLADLFNLGTRFMRSAHLERDFQDPSAFANYVVTDFNRGCLERVAAGLRPSSGQRAWRLTGDYGSGKSSFALLLAHWFAGYDGAFNRPIREVVDYHQFGVPRPRFIPVLVTCSRQALGTSILNSVHRTLYQLYARGAKPKLALEIQRIVEAGIEPTEDQVFRSVLEANSRIIKEGKGKGLFLVLDELGKSLEFAALHPERQDVFLLQRLAEAAIGSGDKPLFVISLLHQGFNAYADHLTQSAQREWEKIAGRFDEIIFDQPLDQVATLISSALNVRVDEIPRAQGRDLKYAMERTIALSWFGSAPTGTLLESATRLYPLHPMMLPVLIRTFRRFGQNERSLFSFLLSSEPFGLQAFSESPVSAGQPYRLHNFYDYVRTNLGHRLAVQSYRSHWNLIDSVVESFASENDLNVQLLKTVGILNLLNDSDLLPTEASIICALAGSDQNQQKEVRAAVEKLNKGKRALYDRGRARGLCLWPHSSADLEKAYDDARRATAAPLHVSSVIKDFLETRPIVARRHYIETGNLRHCEVRYCSVVDLAPLLDQGSPDADGLIIVPLCETPAERRTAMSFATRSELKQRHHWLLAVPQPLNNLASLVQEVHRWEWVLTNTLELNSDKYAREEVSRQRAAARAQLEKRIQSYVGFKQLAGQMMLEWFHKGQSLKIKDGRELLTTLSRIFDEAYRLAPRIDNELVNRRNLSSAAAAARMRLIQRMFAEGTSEFLGMNPKKKPPEMSMYLSVLGRSGLHQKDGNKWRIAEPRHRSDDKSCVLPALRRVREIVQHNFDKRVNIASLFSELRNPPYGVRDGILPLLLTVFAIANQKDTAFYKDGTFLRELNAETMLLLSKAPERFEIQYCKIGGLRAELFERLISVLEVTSQEDREVELLDLVKKLCVFVAELPAYVHNTKKLTATALAVRDAIMNAREPANLLFADLPKACGFAPIASDSTEGKHVHAFVKSLKVALDDLRATYLELQERLRKQLRDAFDFPGSFQQFRTALANRSEQIVLSVTEPKLRAFCLRLMDDNLPESEWLESIGSYLALKPPLKWRDVEEDTFNTELAYQASKFHRIENIEFASGKSFGKSLGVRLAITQSNGVERERVVHITPDEEEQLRELQRQFETLLATDRRLGLAAASRAIWTNLEKSSNPKYD
jgi:hypothetical protein